MLLLVIRKRLAFLLPLQRTQFLYELVGSRTQKR
ncbi:protein of unknown function [Burkholderia multivorans]